MRSNGVPDMPPGPAADLVALLRRLASTCGMSRGALSRKAGLSPGYLSEVFSGKKRPRAKTAELLLAALGATAAEQSIALRLTEQADEIRRYERKHRPEPVDLDLHIAFAAALSDAYARLQDAASRSSAEPVGPIDLAQLRREREHILAVGSPDVAAAAELAFHRLIDLHQTIRQGARADLATCQVAFHAFTEAQWLLRRAVRKEAGLPALTLDRIERVDPASRGACPHCGRARIPAVPRQS